MFHFVVIFERIEFVFFCFLAEKKTRSELYLHLILLLVYCDFNACLQH